MNNDLIIGIDLGTTNSVVSILENSVPRTILVDNNKLLPSAVYYAKEGIIVGQVAKNMAILEPENTILSIKRKMGQNITLDFGNNKLKPEEISSFILKKLRNAVAEQLNINQDKIRAVITVPAYFTEEQREATKQAAELAQLQVERIINEPTAAALAFGLNKMDNALYAIYDFGGGTFDISIIENSSGVIEVLATSGDNHLGGDDIDLVLSNYIWNEFLNKHNISVERNLKINARLIKIAEETKIKLSTENEVKIQENYFLKHDDKSYHLEQVITREEFESLIKEFIYKTVELLEQAVDDSNIDLNRLNGIILVGGSSRIPLITQHIEEKLNIKPMLIDLPDEAVSHGATIQGAIINHIDVDTILIDITPYSLGIEVLGNYSFLNDDRNLETAFLISKNTNIPVKRSKEFNAVVPFQKVYQIKVYQGESINPDENKLIGETSLKVKNPVEDGIVDVTFELDINGLLKVSAVQQGTGDSVEAVFQSSKGIKTKQNNLIEDIVTIDQATQSIINRVDKLILTKQLAEDDRIELQQLSKKYKKEKLENNPIANKTEMELLDLLYYIEQN